MRLKLSAVCAAAFSLFFFNNAIAQQGMGVGNTNPQEMLDVTGAIKIGTDINNSNAAPTGGAGTIRFRAGQFEGWDGGSWIPLGSGSGNSPFIVSSNLVQPNTSFVAYATDDFIFGSPSLDDNANTDNDNRFFFDKSKAAFRAGSVSGDQWDDFKRGNFTFAAGYDVTASAPYSISMGEKSWSTAIGAISMGRQAYAEGARSFAWGNDVQATGEGSVALGRLAFSTADYSYAIGTNVNASAEYSMVVGADANATDPHAIALGNNVNATAASAFVLGHNSTASAWEAAAIGYDVTALGEQSIGFGHDLAALSNYEVVLGRFNSLYVPAGVSSWELTDRLFTIGNGEGSSNRSNALTILKNGNTGIGTSTPSATLHIDGSMRLVDGNQSNGYVLTSDGAGNATWQAANTGSDNQNLTGATLTGTNLQIDIEDGTSTTVDLSALVDDADADASNELQTLSQSGTDVTLSNGGGTISVADNDDNSSNELQTLSVSGADVTLSNGGGTVTVNDGDWTVNGNDQYSAVSGRVGIGTTTPNSKLHVAGGGYFENNLTSIGDVRLENTNGSGTNNPLFRLDGFQDKLYIVAEGGANGPTNGTEIRLRTSGGGTAVDRMTIDNAGNVGVGTTSPTEKLHVNGSIQMEDGNEAVGYIPVSDANGKMTWTDPTTITTAADGDGDASNELQTLSISGSDITLSNGGGTVSVPNDGDWTVSGNDQYSAVSGRVGIGTNAPTSKLHLQSGDLLIDNPSSNNSASRKITIAGARTGDLNPYATIDFMNRDADGFNVDYVGASIRSHNDGSDNGGDLRFLTNSFTRMVINVAGNVGLGTFSPDAKLHVNGPSAGENYGIKLSQGPYHSNIYHQDGDLIIRKSSITDQLVLDGNGNIGIGTNAPADKLQVQGAIRMVDGNQAAGYIPVSDANGTMTWTDPTTLATANDGDWTVSGNDQYSAVSGNVGVGTATPTQKLHVQSGDLLIDNPSSNNAASREITIAGARSGGQNPYASINFQNRDSDHGNTDYTGAAIRSYNASAAVSGDLRFLTKAPNGNATEVMHIHENGHVGIGTIPSVPIWKLTVRNNEDLFTSADEVDQDQYTMVVGNIPASNGQGAGIGFGTQNALLASAGIVYKQTSTTVGDLMLMIKQDAGYYTDHKAALTVKGLSGNIGIGTISPTEKLQVEGSIRMVDGNQQAGYIPVSDANGTMTWTDPLSLTLNALSDADNDTKIQVEESADEDVIRFDVAGLESFRMERTATSGVPSLYFSGSSFYASNNLSPSANNGSNVAIGSNTATALTSPSAGNTFVGSGSGRYTTTATNNTYLGLRAGFAGTTASGNTTIGAYAGEDMVAGNNNVIMGVQAAYNKTGGNNNVLIGAGAGNNNGSGAGNVFLGFQSGWSETGSNKLYIENSNSSLPLVYGEFNNDWIKINGNLSATDGFTDNDNDTKIQLEESSDEDVIRFDVGGTEHFTMNGSQLGVHNSGRSVRIGENAGAADDLTNNDNTFVGYETGLTVTTGYNNTAVGTRAFSNGNGYDNAAFGNWTLNATTGVRNTALGSRAGQSIVGNENTIVGSFAGKDATGSGNVFLGHAAGQSESGDNKLYIENTNSSSPLIYGEFNNDIVAINGELGVGTQAPEALLHASSGSTGDANGLKLTQGTANSLIYHNSGNDLVIRKAAHTDQLVLDDGGNVGVGTSAPASKLHVTTSGLNGFENFAARIENTSNWSNYSNGLRITAGQNFQTDNNRFISFRRPDGTEVGAVRQTSSSGVDFWSPSDKRLKTNIQATTKGLADLMQLRVKDYVYKDDPEKPQTGFLAQEVYEIFPNAVSVGGDDAKTDPWMMNYGNLTPLLVKAVQDLTKLVEEQQKEIEALKALQNK